MTCTDCFSGLPGGYYAARYTKRGKVEPLCRQCWDRCEAAANAEIQQQEQEARPVSGAGGGA